MKKTAPHTSSRVKRILVCGSGLAAQMTVTALSRHLPDSVALVWAKGTSSDTDLFYGNVTPPSSYEFNRSVGLEEPRLVLNSLTAFSYGTEYVRWCGHSWVQAFQQPLPVLDGVSFHHYLTLNKITGLEPYIISAIAGRSGRFAHPPERSDNPLSRAEYGYQFDLDSYARLFADSMAADRVEVISVDVTGVSHDESGITSVQLSDSRTVEADLYVDCTGPRAQLLSALSDTFKPQRRLIAFSSSRTAEALGPPVRRVTAHDFGWQSDTAVQGGFIRLTICAPHDEAAALKAHGGTPDKVAEIITGHRKDPWSGNCVAIGHAAAIIEAHTNAPMVLLQQDILRLLSLLPYAKEDMSVESKDFNRLLNNHFSHAHLFNSTFFRCDKLPANDFWQDGRACSQEDSLSRKLETFSSRGLYISYDDEVYNQEDWLTLFYGLRFTPSRYDRGAERANAGAVKKYLIDLQNHLEATVKAMPSHDVYMNNLRRYLTQSKD